jgi:flagellar biosynthesis protein FlhF
MKIVRHVAPDMRQALRSIRAQLGEDAVILSSRRIPEGVEVTAAVDFDANALQEAMNNPAAAPLPPTSPPASTHALLTARTAVIHTATAQPVAPVMLGQPVPMAHAASIPTYAALAPTAQIASPPVAYAASAPAGPAPSYSQLAGDPAQSHAAASHYFPAHAAADVRPFAHILGDEPAPAPRAVAVVQQPTQPIPTPVAAAPVPAPAVAHAPIAAPAAVKAPAPRREPTLNIAPLSTQDDDLDAVVQLSAAATGGRNAVPTLSAAPTSDSTSAELKTLRRMLETQLAQLAWNDLTRRAPAHVEVLRELTEIGISADLSDHLLKQLPEKIETSAARRFAISGLSQYLRVTGDRWLENGGRVAFIGATGVGKTTTLAKLAVRWVLRHGPRDLALVGSDTVRIGAQDQIQSLGQLLGAPVYTPETFESLPTLLSRLGDRHRLILIDTPGSSLRDAQLPSRLGVLSNCASQMETALVLGASTQAGSLEETVKRFAPANPASCVLTKLDEAASLGGALSALIRARLPVSYVSEGQRVPEDLRPARSLELVSAAVRLAKASGATADEDLLRRRFGKTANAST